MSEWQKLIAHVPQNIYLTDGSIAENIAFGESHNEFDLELLSSVSKIAQIYEFINQTNKSNFMRVNRLYEIKDDQYINYFIVKDLLKSGNIPPLSYLYDRIKTNIINQRKLNLIKSINKEVLEDALKSSKYEVFK